MRRGLSPWGFAVLTAAGGCGDDVAAVAIHVHLNGYEVPAEVDRLHFRLDDAPDRVFWERTYDLPEGETEPVLVVERGRLTPRELTVRVAAVLGTSLVDESAPADVRFRAGEVREVHVSIPGD